MSQPEIIFQISRNSFPDSLLLPFIPDTERSQTDISEFSRNSLTDPSRFPLGDEPSAA